MDFNSGRNWLTAASLGARAVIFIDRQATTSHSFFKEKEELSPIQFPCFWMEEDQALALFGPLSEAENGLIRDKVELRSAISWQNKIGKNIYCLIEGNDPELKEDLLIIEAFYDSTRHVHNRSPGADEAVSVANLLKLAEMLRYKPPRRSVVLIATSGHAQSLHGMRDVIWSLQERSKLIRDHRRELKKTIRQSGNTIKLLDELSFPLPEDSERDTTLLAAIDNDLKFQIDQFSKKLIALRLQDDKDQNREVIEQLASERFALRRIGWMTSFHDIPADEQKLLVDLLPQVKATLKETIADSKDQLQSLESAMDFRSLIRDYNIGAVLSLHLSSHGEGIGGFDRGWLYRLRTRINRTGMFNRIGDIFEAAGSEPSGTARYINSLRPNRIRTWDSYFLDKPFLGGEVSSLAGYIGVTLVTLGDSRALWGTPWDTAEKINWQYLDDQLQLLTNMVIGATAAPKLHDNRFPRNGYSSVTGVSNLLLQGELFADYPSYNTVLLSYQGIAKLYATVHSNGQFLYKGIADSKNVLDKLIIEGYRFNQKSGSVIWAIDKKETGKDNYRVKMKRRAMKTRLIMFACRETTIFDLLEPRSLNYMTKLYLLDGRRDATPQRYWYSRIDTRESIISSIYLEPGSWLKLTLSDNVLTRKLILTNASEETPRGLGFPINEYPQINNTIYRAAVDAWTLLGPRILNLESHGIYDERINSLKERGLQSLLQGARSLDELNYTNFREAAAESLALAARVYSQIEKTQKDVLFGVLFYIALFVPFAFCMERFLFSYANIYKRIVAFLAILIGLILIIYNVHPAFELAYSPMVVILAFFILGLSFMVTLIIFFRFEEEMILLQRHAAQLNAVEISRWKAFVAAFFLGVSNLRRRRIRTVLTCSTLIILTFTIMSFTTVKSSQQENRLFFHANAPYQGLLLKKLNWQSMPPQATEILQSSMSTISNPAPRIWLEAADPARSVQVPLRNGTQRAELQGLVGLSRFEAEVTGLDSLLSAGRWFEEGDFNVIILSDSTAAELGVSAGGTDTVLLWGSAYTVIGTFPEQVLDTTFDLDGEPLTPVTFPQESAEDLSDIEYEAIESGDDIRSFQSRYVHVPAAATAFIPAETLLAMGGKLKNIAIRPEAGANESDIASRLVDRFSMAIFAGTDDGVWLYNISDTMAYSGVPNIIIPLLISVLIVLNTMISSVYERKNEIGIYTSVGLAPSHVSFLFVAEAMALAVISVVLGYLVAQISAAFLSSTSFWEGITVNYSSMAGVAAMILVICVVLISVIYPSRVAARIAIPDVNRSFTLPDPVNNSITVTLPFFMKFEEHESIGGFLHNYFIGHQDISHGKFSTGHVELIHSCDSVEEIQQVIARHHDPYSYLCLHLRAKVWLAPFDFGIMQRVDIQFCPAKDNLSYLEIKLSIHRESGEIGQWQRINKIFIHQLRKQLLIWRSMDQATHTQFISDFRKIKEERLDLH
jgi:ABC-type lipoprotein release transport system permease subunit